MVDTVINQLVQNELTEAQLQTLIATETVPPNQVFLTDEESVPLTDTFVTKDSDQIITGNKMFDANVDIAAGKVLTVREINLII